MAQSAATRSRRSNSRGDVGGAINSIKDDFSHVASTAAGAVRAGLHAGEERVKQAVDAAGDRLHEAHGMMSKRIRERPLTYAGAAAAIGIALGLLLARR